MDCKLTTLDPEGALLTGHCVLELLDEMGVKPDAIGGLSVGADPLVTATGVVSDPEKGRCLVSCAQGSEKARSPETVGRLENPRGKTVVIVDEVCTTAVPQRKLSKPQRAKAAKSSPSSVWWTAKRGDPRC